MLMVRNGQSTMVVNMSKTSAHLGYCKQCNHYALLAAKYGGLCLPCACWSPVQLKHHHMVTLSGTFTPKGTNVVVPVSQVKPGHTCPICKVKG